MRKILVLLLMFALSALAAERATIQDGFLQVPGGPVWYRITGGPGGLPLMVLHGGPGGTSCGFSRLEPMAEVRPVIRYDQLGTGRSGRPDDPGLWQVDRFVEELHEVRNQLGLERMHLLGHSWGGSLAAQYVLDKGSDGIESLILSSPLLSTPDWIEDANELRGLLPADVQRTLTLHEEAGTTDSEEYQAATDIFYARHVWGGEPMEAPEACAGAPGNDFIYNFMWGPTEFYATGNLVDFDVTARLGELDLPVLLMAGADDEARPERLREYQGKIAGARLEIIEDAAHASLSRQPARYMEVLSRFLAEVESRGESPSGL